MMEVPCCESFVGKKRPHRASPECRDTPLNTVIDNGLWRGRVDMTMNRITRISAGPDRPLCSRLPLHMYRSVPPQECWAIPILTSRLADISLTLCFLPNNRASSSSNRQRDMSYCGFLIFGFLYLRRMSLEYGTTGSPPSNLSNQ